jgi:hypothetical protein
MDGISTCPLASGTRLKMQSSRITSCEAPLSLRARLAIHSMEIAVASR